MKTIEELYKSILADNALKAQCAEAIKGGKLDEFLKVQGCDATAEDVKAFIESKKEASFDELDSTAGGCETADVLISVFGFGIGCGIVAAFSTNTNISLPTESDLCGWNMQH